MHKFQKIQQLTILFPKGHHGIQTCFGVSVGLKKSRFAISIVNKAQEPKIDTSRFFAKLYKDFTAKSEGCQKLSIFKFQKIQQPPVWPPKLCQSMESFVRHVSISKKSEFLISNVEIKIERFLTLSSTFFFEILYYIRISRLNWK